MLDLLRFELLKLSLLVLTILVDIKNAVLRSIRKNHLLSVHGKLNLEVISDLCLKVNGRHAFKLSFVVNCFFLIPNFDVLNQVKRANLFDSFSQARENAFVRGISGRFKIDVANFLINPIIVLVNHTLSGILQVHHKYLVVAISNKEPFVNIKSDFFDKSDILKGIVSFAMIDNIILRLI